MCTDALRDDVYKILEQLPLVSSPISNGITLLLNRQIGSVPWLEALFHSTQRTNSKTDLKSSDSLTMQNYVSRGL